MQQRKSGFILVLAIGMVAVISLLLSGIIQRVMMFSRLSPALVRREQAQVLARSGIEIACAQLAAIENVPSNEKTDESKKTSDRIVRTVKLLNQPQTFEFTPEHEGISGSCALYISSEQGKIDINSLYDFKTNTLIKTETFDARAFCDALEKKFGTSLKVEQFAEKLTAFFKERKKPLNDLSELLTDSTFFKGKTIPLFSTLENSLALSDLFTVEVKQLELQPLLLSETMKAVMGLVPNSLHNKKHIQQLEEKRAMLTASLDWKKQWNELLAPLYGKEYNSLTSGVRQLFTSSFEVRQFLVIAQGQVYGITQRCAAVLERKLVSDENKSSEQTAQKSSERVDYCIKKLYWL